MLLTKAINSILTQKQKKTDYLEEKGSSNVDLKVHDLALDTVKVLCKMQKAPFYNYVKHPLNEKEKKSLLPIGIKGLGSNSWINALIQFIIYVPGLRNMFDFTPKSFKPFNVFIDCYEYDRGADKSLTAASSGMLIECLRTVITDISLILTNDKIDIYKVLLSFMRLICPQNFFKNNFFLSEDLDLLAFHPKWQLFFEGLNEQFEEFVLNEVKKMQFPPKELLIAFKPDTDDLYFAKRPIAKKNIFYWGKDILCLELDAFIEYRFDPFSGEQYLTYLKVEKKWYQCDDERIVKIDPKNINLALGKTILAHYKKEEKNNLYANI
ncbi:MAG: hypothetical protein HZB76_03645 [Chlamydiae bacterium]|nr:hypothetical protein [Chlamydiota bacterium]